MKQKDMAEILGATKGALNQRLNTILRKMRNIFQMQLKLEFVPMPTKNKM